MAALVGRIFSQVAPKALGFLGLNSLVGSFLGGSNSSSPQPQQQPQYTSVYPQTGDHRAVQYQPSLLNQIESFVPMIALGVGGLCLFNWYQEQR